MSDHAPTDALGHFRQQQARRFADRPPACDALIGQSPAMRRLRAQVDAAAASGANVTIVGTEAGQLLDIAQAVHYRRSPEGELPLVRVDAVLALPSELERSFRLLAGPAEHVGTLLIESIDHLPADQQAELLTAAAADDWHAQIVATRLRPQDGESMVDSLSDELAAVLATITIEVPPLAQRPEDIPQLADWYLDELNRQAEQRVAGLADEALDRLMLYDWPGELAELRAAIENAHRTCRTERITPTDLPQVLQQSVEQAVWSHEPPQPIDLDAYLGRVEALLVERALELAGGNKAEAARLLGVSRPRLYRKLEQMGLVEPTPAKSDTPAAPPARPEEPPAADDDIEFVPVDGQ